jgi:hypothetical protein
MTITRMTEKVNVRLVSGEEAEVLIYKYVTFREQQKIYGVLFKNTKLTKKSEDTELSPENLFEVLSTLAEMVWADKNYTLDDINGDSLSEIIVDRFESFLGRLGFKVENGHNQSTLPKKD